MLKLDLRFFRNLNDKDLLEEIDRIVKEMKISEKCYYEKLDYFNELIKEVKSRKISLTEKELQEKIIYCPEDVKK